MSRAIDKGTMLNLIIEAKRTDPETGSFAEWLAEYLVDHLPTLTQPNEPLTLEELSLCNDPVWIKRIADRNLSDDGWAIVEGPRCSTWFNGIPMSWEIRVWWPGSEVADYPKHEDYGKTWLAYRCSPNKGAKDKNIPTNGPLTLEELTLMTEPTPVWWDWVQGWVLARKGMIMSWNGGYYDSEILKGNFYRHPLEEVLRDGKNRGI